MLTLFGNHQERFCDGISRRGFLRVGALGLGGAALPQILQANSASESGKTGGLNHKAVIMVFLPGGPPHQDMFDLKTDAPSDIRGEFSPISTKVPGIQICEEFPRIARQMDQFTVIRSMVGAAGGHDAYQCLTGRSPRGAPPGGWPSLGAVVSRLQGAADKACPPFLGLSPKCGHDEWGDPGSAGFLGPAYSPFTPFRGSGSEDMVLKGVSLERLGDRKALLGSFDNMRRDVDRSGMIEGMDAFHEQAFGVLTSSKMAEAFDISQEPESIRKLYGTEHTDLKLRADGCWKRVDQFLMARRLVEAGARVVTLGFSRWDWHGGNFARGREDFPLLDMGVSGLVQDLKDRGLEKDVAVVVWGEFGRTPQINKNAGRDHWPRVSCALMAGGEMNHGQVIGATDRLGGEAVDRPVQFPEVFSTLYHHMGIDARSTTVEDLTGRPRYLVDPQHAPMKELIA